MPQKPKGNVTELTVTFCSDESLEIGGPDVDYARDHMKGLRTFLKEHSVYGLVNSGFKGNRLADRDE